MTSKVIVPRREAASVATLLIGGITYFFLCGPAIGQRGYPPLDPVWIAVTFLWVVPVLISCWFDSWSQPRRRLHLLVYALATACVDSATPVTIVPKHINAFEIVLGTALFFGPYHIVATLFIEAIVQGTLGMWRSIAAETTVSEWRPRFSLLAVMYFCTIFCIAIGLPIGFRTFTFQMLQARGKNAAERDWLAGKSSIYAGNDPFEVNGAIVEYEIDRDTGLWFHRPFRNSEFAESYNERIQELLHKDGGKVQALKESIPTPEQIVDLLDSSDLSEVTSFPHEITPSIIVFRRGTISRWGSTMSSQSDDLSIAAEEGRTVAIGGGIKPVFSGIDQPTKGLVTIRNGNSWVGIFQKKDGRQIAWASR
jgi:hypothetical protein